MPVVQRMGIIRKRRTFNISHEPDIGPFSTKDLGRAH